MEAHIENSKVTTSQTPNRNNNDQYELMTDYDLMVNHNISDTVSSSELFNPEEEIL